MMSDKTTLTSKVITELKEKANQCRKNWGVFPDVPVGNDLFKLLEEKEKIIICEYPFQTATKANTDATITIFESVYGQFTFIGLNSSIYMDEQIFALAHEMYHYLTRTGKAYDSSEDAEDHLVEAKADRFAAELLLPYDVLKQRVERYFPDDAIAKAPFLRLLRFIAALHGEWWLPFRSIVRRLNEEGFITSEQFSELLEVDSRNPESEYAKIFKNLDPVSYGNVNLKSEEIRISKEAIMATVSNYEDGDISYDEFVETLTLFNKKPSDFGYEAVVEEDEDLSFLFKEDADES